jgi:chaperonin GroES
MAKMDRKHKELVLRTVAGIEALGLEFLGERFAILRDPSDDVSKGGIIIPDEAKRSLPKGTVVAVATGSDFGRTELAPYECKVLDRVLFTKYGGNTFKITLPDDTDVELELISVLDVYIKVGKLA